MLPGKLISVIKAAYFYSLPQQLGRFFPGLRQHRLEAALRKGVLHHGLYELVVLDDQNLNQTSIFQFPTPVMRGVSAPPGFGSPSD